MKKKIIIPLSLGALTTLTANASEPIFKHTVSKGESFSSIVRRYASLGSEPLSFSSREYRRDLKKFKDLNNKIRNYNKIFVGDEIFVPKELVPHSDYASYTIQKGDTLFEIAKTHYENSYKESIFVDIQKMNPFIKDINIIWAGDTITLPIFNPKKATVNKRDVAEEYTGFQSNYLLEEQIYHLSREEAGEFVTLYRDLVKAKEKLDVMKLLKESLELSRLNGRDELEKAFLFLISSTLQSTHNDHYLKDIRSFFDIWKSIRKQRHENDK